MFLSRAGRWFLESGIEEPGGGVARYYRADQGKNLPVSTEITGYAASTYAYLFRVTGEPAYRDAAVRTARFLASEAWSRDAGTFPFELAPGSPGYFFDCGIIVRGLRAVDAITGGAEFAPVAAACGESMVRLYLTSEAIHPVVSLPGGAAWSYEKRWSREPGCFQLKSALAWRDLGMKDPWERALGMALASAPSFLPGTLEEEKIMDRLHAYCYFLEALLSETARPEVTAELRRSIDRVAGYLRAIRPKFERADVYAQLLRVRMFADRLGVVPLQQCQAEEEAAALGGFQYPAEAELRHAGGFSFGRKGGVLLPFVNPVSTGFALQALEMWRQYQEGRFEPALDQLI